MAREREREEVEGIKANVQDREAEIDTLTDTRHQHLYIQGLKAKVQDMEAEIHTKHTELTTANCKTNTKAETLTKMLKEPQAELEDSITTFDSIRMFLGTRNGLEEALFRSLHAGASSVPKRIGGGCVGRGHFVTSQTWGYNPTKLVAREAFFLFLLHKKIQEKLQLKKGKHYFRCKTCCFINMYIEGGAEGGRKGGNERAPPEPDAIVPMYIHFTLRLPLEF